MGQKKTLRLFVLACPYYEHKIKLRLMKHIVKKGSMNKSAQYFKLKGGRIRLKRVLQKWDLIQQT
jgi:hypothetical protein